MEVLNSDAKHIFSDFVQPPSSFVGTMEEYIREAPRTAPGPNETIVIKFLFDFLLFFRSLCIFSQPVFCCF
jgi:hypothetical protein